MRNNPGEGGKNKGNNRRSGRIKGERRRLTKTHVPGVKHVLALKPIKNDSNKNDCVQIMIHINTIYGSGGGGWLLFKISSFASSLP